MTQEEAEGIHSVKRYLSMDKHEYLPFNAVQSPLDCQHVVAKLGREPFALNRLSKSWQTNLNESKDIDIVALAILKYR